jgi:hypothetical protein
MGPVDGSLKVVALRQRTPRGNVAEVDWLPSLLELLKATELKVPNLEVVASEEHS